MWTISIYVFFHTLFCGNSFGALGERTDLLIGALLHGPAHTVEEHISIYGINVTVIWHYIDDGGQFYNVFKTVCVLEDDDHVDVIVLLDVNFANILNRKSVRKTYNKTLIWWGEETIQGQFWGDSIQEHLFLPHLEINNDYIPDTHVCIPDITTSQDDTQRLIDGEGLRKPTWQHHPFIDKPSNPGPPVLAKLVDFLKWKYVIVIYENTTEPDTAILEDLLSEIGVLFAVYNIDRMTADLKSIYKMIYDYTLKTKDRINFLVLCRMECASNVLIEANDFDSKHNANKTVIKNLSRWLVGLYDKANIKCLQYSAHELDNVVVVSVSTKKMDKPSVFNSTLRKCMLELGFNHSHSDVMAGETISDILTEKIAKASAVRASDQKNCVAYKIETLQWKTDGREFGSVGFVNSNGTIFITSDLFPNSKYGYNMREFLISVVEYPPYVVKTTVNGTIKYTGFCLDILKELSRNLNFTYSITEPVDNAYGMVVEPESMQFNGLIGQLQRNEVDMIVSDVAIQRDREQVMDFTYPFYFGYSTVMVKKYDPNQYRWKKLLEPFRWEVVAMLIGMLLLAALVIHLLEKHNPFNEHETKHVQPNCHNCRVNKCGFLTYTGSLMWLFGIISNEGNVHMPGSVAGRTFVSSWTLFCVVIIATYSGNLIAFLTVTKDKFPFNSLLEMSRKDDTYKWGTIGGSAWEQVLTTSDLPEFKAVGNALRRFNMSDPTVLIKSQAYHLRRVAEDENYAFIGDDAAIDITVAKNCDLIKIKERFLPLTNAFGFPDKSPHTRIFSKQLMSFHGSGLLAVWKRHWWPDSNRCRGNIKTEAKAIELIDVQSAFYILIGGIFISVVALMAECVAYKRNGQNVDTEEDASDKNVNDSELDN